jgi:PAS domain S-box-containing protein
LKNSNTSRDRMIQLHRLSRWLLAGLAVVCPVNSIWALDPANTISQYVYEKWGADQGFLGGAIYAISQSADGYLWIGTERGLVRFDGKNFTLIQRPVPDSPPIGPVLGLVSDAEQDLWVRVEGPHLLLYRDGGFQDVYSRFNLTEPTFTAMARDNEGSLLLSGLGGRPRRYRHGKFETVTNSEEVPGTVISLAEARDLTVWMGTRDDGLFRIDERHAPNLPKELVDKKINALLAAKNGGLWIGTDDGLRFLNNTGSLRAEATLWAYHDQVLALTRDRDGNTWAGTNRGLVRITASGQLVTLGSVGGVTTVFEDRDGNLWFGGPDGLERLQDGVFATYSRGNGYVEGQVGPLYVDPDGRVWFAPYSGGLDVLENGRIDHVRVAGLDSDIVYSIDGSGGEVWVGRQRGGLTKITKRGSTFAAHSYSQKDGLSQNSVYAVHGGRDGAIWAGTVSGGLSEFRDGKFKTYAVADGLTSNTVNALCEGQDAALWVATPTGLDRYAGQRWQHWTSAEGLPSADVRTCFEDSQQMLWLATSSGLAYMSGGKIYTPHNLPEVLREQIYGITEDKLGHMWFSTSDHIIRVSHDSILAGSVRATDIQAFGPSDGLIGAGGVRRDRSLLCDAMGRIWVSTDRGIASATPERTLRDPGLIAVRIDSVVSGAAIFGTRGSPVLPAGSRNVTINYAGESLSAPDHVRFRYKLDGADQGWSGPVDLRQVNFNNLTQGTYHFHVIASKDGVLWNSPETTVSFSIDRSYWQTIWFRLLCVAAFLAFLWGLYHLRVQQLRQEEEKLREAIETIPAMVWIAGPDWAVQFRNRRVVDYTGLPQLGKGEKGGAISVHPEDQDRIVRRLGASSASGEPFEEEMRIRRIDGEYRWFLCRAVPLRDKRGKIVKWYGAATDIQDRKRAEELQAELAHTNRVSTMGELVASISHELAQPITATTNNAKASLRWLQRDPPDLAQVRKGTESIVEAGIFASQIIDRLRSLYKKAPPKRELVTINEVIAEMVPLLRSKAYEYAVSIRMDLAADLPGIMADQVQLQQVLMNLMLNGIEAMKEAGGVLTVKTERSECGKVLISVTDTGVGLPAGRADEIFNPFFTTKPQGSGMGLAISRSIVESHGGRLWAASNDGRGVTFHFTLPTAAV